ncbi:helix-turn-helix domain-containing protein [Undibacterium sp. SXout7W]|uniref:helix-turn-helix domain-containing protein n=1 Tax=Undibacterium sp. SXout7W TaxID=3413049 RepID=UPI003BF2F11B
MSNEISEVLFGVGARLAEERARLGYSQNALATLLAKTSRTQIKYESGETNPDTTYLFNLNKLGADIYYIVTGTKSTNSISKDEQEVIDGYRALDLRGKAGVLALISGMIAPVSNVSMKGKVGQQIIGDITGSNTVNMSSNTLKK